MGVRESKISGGWGATRPFGLKRAWVGWAGVRELRSPTMEDPSAAPSGSPVSSSAAEAASEAPPRSRAKKTAPAATTATRKTATTAKAPRAAMAKSAGTRATKEASPNVASADGSGEASATGDASTTGEAPATGKATNTSKATTAKATTAKATTAKATTAEATTTTTTTTATTAKATAARATTTRATTARERASESAARAEGGSAAGVADAPAPVQAPGKASGVSARVAKVAKVAKAAVKEAGGTTRARVRRAPRVAEAPLVEELLAAAPDTRDTAHIDDALIRVARDGAVQVDVAPQEIEQLELELTGLEPVRRTAPPRTAAPSRTALPDPAGPSTAGTRPPRTDQGAHHIPLWARVVADPGYAAEHMAREAIYLLGPQARDWAVRTSARYPTATPDALARLATKEAVRTARRQGAASGAAGVLGSVAVTGALAHAHARLVLTVAAVYGFDPTTPDRARDLLAVLRVPRLTQPTTTALRNVGRLVAGFTARRVAARLMPFGAAVAGATIGARSTADVGERAMAQFRRHHRA